MVLDLRALAGRSLSPPAKSTATPASSPAGRSLSPPATAHSHAATEPVDDRAARVRRLSEIVRSGAYTVHTRRLALALLDWDPRRSALKGSPDVAGRRRAYMREYMRRRRALEGEPGRSPPASRETSAGYS